MSIPLKKGVYVSSIQSHFFTDVNSPSKGLVCSVQQMK
ncbi:hypothetical protein RV05_GL000188 [Enterococcus hirae]|nr:hypothetical protein RV05_GL000188 [Enterococcus hirae]